jgi:hypothetical protein
MRKLNVTIAALAATLSFGSAASAAVVITQAGAGNVGTGANFNSIPASTVLNAPSPIVIGDWTFTNGSQPVQVNIGGSGNGAQPLGTTGNYLSVLGAGTENVAFSARSSFSFFWGSIDDYNTIAIHHLVGPDDVFTGSQVATIVGDGVQATGCQVLTNCNRYFTFTGVGITGFSMSSSQNSFEITNISAIPEPSTWAMMILGFLGLGFMGYRKRSSGSAFRIA